MGSYIFQGIISVITLLGTVSTAAIFFPKAWTAEAIGYWVLTAGGWIVSLVYSLILSKQKFKNDDILEQSQNLTQDVDWLKCEFTRTNTSLEYATSVISHNYTSATPIQRAQNDDVKGDF